MLASAIQLAAGIIFAVAVFARKTRKDKDIHDQTLTILNSTGDVNPRVHQLLYETYMFRIGTVVLSIGYLLPIAGIEYDGCSSPVINTLAVIGIAGIIVTVTHLLSVYLKDKRIARLKGYKPPGSEQRIVTTPEQSDVAENLRFIIHLKDGRIQPGKCSSLHHASYVSNRQRGFYVEEPYIITEGKWEPSANLSKVWIPEEQILKFDFLKD